MMDTPLFSYNICRRSVPACRHYDITDILVAYWSANNDVIHLTRIIDYAALHPDLELYSTLSSFTATAVEIFDGTQAANTNYTFYFKAEF